MEAQALSDADKQEIEALIGEITKLTNRLYQTMSRAAGDDDPGVLEEFEFFVGEHAHQPRNQGKAGEKPNTHNKPEPGGVHVGVGVCSKKRKVGVIYKNPPGICIPIRC